MKYYCHDTNMRYNRKVSVLRKRMGLQGYALWNIFLEILAENEGAATWDDIEKELFCEEYDVEEDILDEFLSFCTRHGMLSVKDDVMRCPAMEERIAVAMEERQAKSEELSQKRREAAIRRWSSKEEDDMQNDAKRCKRMQVHNLHMQNDANGCKSMQVHNLHMQNDANGCKSMQVHNLHMQNDANDAIDLDIEKKEEPKGSKKEEAGVLSDVLQFFNKTISETGSIIPPIRSFSEERRVSVRARAREYGEDAVYEAITAAARSDFLNGKNGNGFVATFDWIFKPKNFPKVLEGNYANKQPTSTTNNTTRHDTNDYRNECLEAVQELLAEGSQPRHAPSILRGI